MKKIKKFKKEYANIDRRNFLAKSSVALASLGLSPMLSAEILNDLAQMIIPSAQAQTAAGGKRRLVSLHLRAGAPLQELTPPPAWVQSVSNTPDARINFHTDPAAITTNAASGSRMLYLPSTATALQAHAAGIAATYSQQQMDGHTSIWSNQTGGMRVDDQNIPMTAPPSPTVYNAAKQQLGAMLGGVFFNSSGNDVVNSLNAYSDLNRVSNTAMTLNNSDDFVAMFGPKVLRFTAAERDAVLSAVSKLGDNHVGRLKARLTAGSVDEARQGQREATTLMQTNIQAGIIADYNDLINNRGFNVAPPRGMGYPLSKALALSAVSFQRNLASTTQVAISITDFHGFNSTDRSGNLLPAQVATYLANTLGAFCTYLKATADPINTGSTLWDNTVIALTTEFWRDSFLNINVDNGDGGESGVIYIGGPVNGGFYGDVSPTTGASHGFNLTTGASEPGTPDLHPASVYRTMLTLLGHPQADISMAMGANASLGPLISAMVKS